MSSAFPASCDLPIDLIQLIAEQGIIEPKAMLDAIAAAAIDQADDRWLSLLDPAGRLNRNQRTLLTGWRDQRMPAPPGGKNRAQRAQRLAALRHNIAAQGLDGFLLPRTDEYLNEYVASYAERLAWLTGFAGSAGMAAVLAERAALFVDGRYWLQAQAEVDDEAFTLLPVVEIPPQSWLAGQLQPGQRIGIDPWLHTAEQAERLTQDLAKADVRLVELDHNPIDLLWSDQPPPPLGPVSIWPLACAGRPTVDKIAALAEDLTRRRIGAAVLPQPEALAWLLNIRGCDVPHTPLPLGFGVLSADRTVELFIDARKLLPETRAHLAAAAVRICPVSEFLPSLAKWQGQRILIDASAAPAAILRCLEAVAARIVREQDPCALPRACKNDVELAGMRAAHRRDGVAMVRFLAWLETAVLAGGQTEISLSDTLERLRREGAGFRDLSFPTISAAGANGAIVHYRASAAKPVSLMPGMLYLVDSGAQYDDGTTDVTRTLALGAPSAEQRDRFTRVLKGHISLSTAVFPVGTTGSQLDALARQALWRAGLDYDHGTGHGVGCFLSVHEGPQRIAKSANSVALQPGMILSNEPGYYKSGAFGIRIENLLAVIPVAIDGAERKMLGFEPLTLAPIDRRLIASNLLTPDERAWVDAYHERVKTSLIDLLDREAAAWLQQATAALADDPLP